MARAAGRSPAPPASADAPARGQGQANPTGAGTTDATAATRGGPPLQLGVLAEVLGYHIAQAAVVTVGTFERHVGRPLGLRKVEYSLLLLLLANGPQAPKRLGQALALSAPNLTLLLDKLQERGLILRERSQTDRRSQNIVLTVSGRQVAEQGAAAARPMEAALSDRLSHAERLMLIELLRKVSGC